MKEMKYKVFYDNGKSKVVKGKNAAEVFKHFDRVFAMYRLDGEGRVESEIDLKAVEFGLNEIEEPG